jgi:hypothetical protein
VSADNRLVVLCPRAVGDRWGGEKYVCGFKYMIELTTHCNEIMDPIFAAMLERLGFLRGGWLPIEEACRVYDISVDEFLAWERDIDRNGVPGLRTTRYQIYRDTDAQRG